MSFLVSSAATTTPYNQFLHESNGPLSLNSITARLCSRKRQTLTVFAFSVRQYRTERHQKTVISSRATNPAIVICATIKVILRMSTLQDVIPNSASSIEPINLLLDDPGTFVWLRQRNNFLV